MHQYLHNIDFEWFFTIVNFILTWHSLHSPLNVDNSALWILYMLKQLLSSSLMEVMKPGCPGNVESGETSLSWLYPQSIGSQCKIKDQRYRVWSLGPWKSFQVILSIKNTWPLILGILVTVRDGGAEAEQQEQTGGETGTLAQSLTHSVTHWVTHSLFFYRECRSRSSTLPIHVSDTACN